MVQIQPALAGSASVATLLSGVESHRTAMAAHPQERDAQSFLQRPGRIARHADARFWGDAVTPTTDPVLSPSFLLTPCPFTYARPYSCSPESAQRDDRCHGAGTGRG